MSKPDGGKARLNKYTCEKCSGTIITIDRDEGVTPFMLKCRIDERCMGSMTSSFYQIKEGNPTHEWYKPDVGEIMKSSPGMKEHYAQRGLNIRKIAEREKP